MVSVDPCLQVLQAIMRKLSWFSYPMLDTVEFRSAARAISWNAIRLVGGIRKSFHAIRQLRATEAGIFGTMTK